MENIKKLELLLKEIKEDRITIKWKILAEEGKELEARDCLASQPAWEFSLYWADKDTPGMEYQKIYCGQEGEFTYFRSTHIPHYFKACLDIGGEIRCSGVLRTPVARRLNEQIEKLGRGLVAMKTGDALQEGQGIFLSWRLFLTEVYGYTDSGMAGAAFIVYRNGQEIARVFDSTNYLDQSGSVEDEYQVEAFYPEGKHPGFLQQPSEMKISEKVKAFPSGKNYYDIPIRPPKGGRTPSGESFRYHANDMSVGDVDGDGEYEYIVKWDPDNSKDVSQKGYTGHCILDCYKFDGRLLWRLDLGPNIRAGAHYTQFMVYDFNGDGKAEISVKTAPGSKMTRFVRGAGGNGGTQPEKTETAYVTLTESALKAGASHEDNYVCSAGGYREHLIREFQHWHLIREVEEGQWPKTLEECFGIPVRYSYPLDRSAAEELTDYFIHTYAVQRSEKNQLWDFEGFIYEGPEFLTIFSGDGRELETIDFPFGRVDDGLRWGDYAMERIEPCNRVDRFLSGVAYLDGEHPSLIVCRGYYTRSCIAAYDLKEGRHKLRFSVDSGFVPMNNPFCGNPHAGIGTDPAYGTLAGQGNHSLSAADIDGDGCQEIIYGAAAIDHDGSLKYSSFGKLADGTVAKFGHGDAIHVAKIDPDRPGYEIFHVFEGAKQAPYGFALCDAQTGEVLWGEPADRDLGRCMVGDISPGVRGLQCFVNQVFDCKGNALPDKVLGTNQPVRFAADLSTQMIDGPDYVHGKHEGIVNDNTHGILLLPEEVCVNNGTKGNPCLVADILGDFREEILYRRADDKAIRIYFSCELTKHKLFTLMHDVMYRTGVAWQNNCYNQPGYTKFYLASDMEWEYVLPGMEKVLQNEK